MSTNDGPTLLRNPAFMRVFLDLVIPPSADGTMPGAGSLGLTSDVADGVEADPSFGPGVQLALRAVNEAALARDPGGLAALPVADRLEVVEAQAKLHPALMFGITRHLYPAYYQHPRVLEGLGEPARPPFPEGFDIEPTDPRLLEKLQARRRS